MDSIAGKVMLLSGARRYFLAVLAGIIGGFSMPPCDLFFASFVSFTLLIWLLDGVSSTKSRTGSISRIESSFFLGWLFGIGYFLVGLWCLREGIIYNINPLFPFWGVVIFVAIIPFFLAIFYGIATAMSSLLWSTGMGRICIFACAVGFSEWLRSFIGIGTWCAIGYAAMPIPLMMQSVHLIGSFGMNALSVFCFSSPALFGTRKDVNIGISISSILLISHVLYGLWILIDDSKYALNFDKISPIIRIVQPDTNDIIKEDYKNILDRYLSLAVLPVSSGELEPSVIVWAGLPFPYSLIDQPDTLKRIANSIKKEQLLILGSIRKELLNGKSYFYKSVYIINSKGEILSSSNAKHLIPFFEYLPYRNILKKLNFDLAMFPLNYSVSDISPVLELSEKLRLYPLLFSDVFFYQDIDKSLESSTAILNIMDASGFMDYNNDNSLRYSQIRAVEIGLPLIRAKNNGASAFIDERGRIISSMHVGRNASIDIHFQSKVKNRFYSNIQMRFFLIIEFILLILAIIA
ncbi:apolipoprotein N-acyltransferase [Candidatus Liberibacter brunswickensis]|uniref:apolipoprotein N-acyltransferase n=1 Tax=Candidatus Liberibacter brunswickensis TaxID=1968796 RepID=UPI002FE31BAC